jgi:hypothetical protein
VGDLFVCQYTLSTISSNLRGLSGFVSLYRERGKGGDSYVSVVNTQKNASVLTTDACVLTMLLQTHRRMCADYVTTDAWVWTSLLQTHVC